MATKKLSDIEYTGDKKTFTDRLSPEQIKDLLDGYELVSFKNVKLGYHVRYFKKADKTEFRLGGTVVKINDDYIVLTNGTANWSVQKKTAVIYQQEPIVKFKKRITEEHQSKINELMSLIREQDKKIKVLEKQIASMTKK